MVKRYYPHPIYFSTEVHTRFICSRWFNCEKYEIYPGGFRDSFVGGLLFRVGVNLVRLTSSYALLSETMVYIANVKIIRLNCYDCSNYSRGLFLLLSTVAWIFV